MDQYLEAIQAKVCTHCIDADSAGNCRIGGSKVCPIETKYSQIVRAIRETKGDAYDDYVNSLRKYVCSGCTYGDPEACDERSEVECALDRYFPMIIDAVEAIGFSNFRNSTTLTIIA